MGREETATFRETSKLKQTLGCENIASSVFLSLGDSTSSPTYSAFQTKQTGCFMFKQPVCFV
ncbi:hypothetical protein [Ethanoligenens harbinense]|uniref:Uncharacterized protein n=1 Tax=Ethanoligenens harbinense (strain DSM 18485 / JCM 12961 / CGMCC 1.5033 / YUAN-3) TaxID=663278 RepID=E6U4V1_ETHHY|nr:hypothetical protein [Ethanoligenens harbinense]ADU27836.1 hypothetical protein Ethha_2324 [Ethanoligenens harbinense YUAN-3]AVQ96858.1 hypothetical protein CXQ68_11955 [Ethanoligenens harbinense YUAN-3]AYF39520.1 hypothetical protein CXP51_11850 [Ethanoligenens harbinense]AYF42345.1 hypothetical protein CN246_12400 [Ethanoligenens harbinense]QCN93099.1 hypothetical protein DRA42_11990 [Ethanoligenens harbinense]